MRKKDLKPIMRTKDGSATVTIRLSARLTNILGGTAAVFGMSLEEYALRTLKRQAREIEREAPATRLSRRDFRRFLDICQRPGRPNAALRRATERYKKAMGTARRGVAGCAAESDEIRPGSPSGHPGSTSGRSIWRT